MRIIGLDHGTKRIGIAVSDELQMIAQPLTYLDAEPSDLFFEKFRQLLSEYQVAALVLGLPKNMNGTLGPAAEKAREFGNQLKEKLQLPLHYVDERLTTSQVNRVMIEGNVRRDKRKEKVDQMAAALILQQYLDLQSLA